MERVPLLLLSEECAEVMPQYLCKGEGALQFLRREEGTEARSERAHLKRSTKACAQCARLKRHVEVRERACTLDGACGCARSARARVLQREELRAPRAHLART